MEKLLSEKLDQGNQKVGVSLGGLAFVESESVLERDLIAGKQYS